MGTGSTESCGVNAESRGGERTNSPAPFSRGDWGDSGVLTPDPSCLPSRAGGMRQPHHGVFLPRMTRRWAGNSALSEALLAGLAEHPEPALRWYLHAARGAGAGQRAEAAYRGLRGDADAGSGRVSPDVGGHGGVVDANALSMEVALPAGHPLASSDIVRRIAWLGEVWAEALRSLGVPRRGRFRRGGPRAAVAGEGRSRAACLLRDSSRLGGGGGRAQAGRPLPALVAGPASSIRRGYTCAGSRSGW